MPSARVMSLDGSLLAEDFKTGQIPQGPKGDKGDRGDKGDNATNLWAEVSSVGSLGKAKGATASSLIATGDFEVVFNRDVTECVPLATQSFIANGFASATQKIGVPNTVSVSTWSTVGQISLSFFVAVFC